MSATNGILFRGIVASMGDPRRPAVPPDPVLRADNARLLDMPETGFFVGRVVQSEKVFSRVFPYSRLRFANSTACFRGNVARLSLDRPS